MKYFHRSHASPELMLRLASEFFGSRLTPVAEGARQRTFSGAIGRIGVTVQAEGGHYTLVTVETDQVGESTVFTMVWPVLKSLPPIAIPRSLASCSIAGKSQVRLGAPLAKGTPSISAAQA